MIGYGFMGKAHSNAYKKVGHFFPSQYQPVLQVLCARDPARAKAFADTWGYKHVVTDWREAVMRDDVDAVDICTPNNLHCEIAIAAANAGKMVLCEKPLSMDNSDGERMVAAIEKAGVANTVWYNYRRIPAVTLAKQIWEKYFTFARNFCRTGRSAQSCLKVEKVSGDSMPMRRVQE